MGSITNATSTSLLLLLLPRKGTHDEEEIVVGVVVVRVISGCSYVPHLPYLGGTFY